MGESMNCSAYLRLFGIREMASNNPDEFIRISKILEEALRLICYDGKDIKILYGREDAYVEADSCVHLLSYIQQIRNSIMTHGYLMLGAITSGSAIGNMSEGGENHREEMKCFNVQPLTNVAIKLYGIARRNKAIGISIEENINENVGHQIGSEEEERQYRLLRNYYVNRNTDTIICQYIDITLPPAYYKRSAMKVISKAFIDFHLESCRNDRFFFPLIYNHIMGFPEDLKISDTAIGKLIMNGYITPTTPGGLLIYYALISRIYPEHIMREEEIRNEEGYTMRICNALTRGRIEDEVMLNYLLKKSELSEVMHSAPICDGIVCRIMTGETMARFKDDALEQMIL